MFWKLSPKDDVKHILVVSLTNIGDIIAVSPAMDVLLNDFPNARLSVVVGPKGQSLFQENPNIHRVYVYDKHFSMSQKWDWIKKLQQENFDVVVDFRNTMIPFLLPVHWRTYPILRVPKDLHLVKKHLWRLKNLYPYSERAFERKAIVVSPKDREYIDQLLRDYVSVGERFVLIAPVAADSAKTWNPSGFARLSDQLISRFGLKIVMVGGIENQPVMQEIQSQMSHPFLSLAGQTNLVQVAEILNRASFSIVHDSGIMHLASYLDRQVLALFGPTDARLSGPWSKGSGYVWNNIHCPRCVNPSTQERHTCMNAIHVDDVLSCLTITDRAVQIQTYDQHH